MVRLRLRAKRRINGSKGKQSSKKIDKEQRSEGSSDSEIDENRSDENNENCETDEGKTKKKKKKSKKDVTEEWIMVDEGIFGKNGRSVLFRRTESEWNSKGKRKHALSKEKDAFLKKLAKKIAISMHLLLLNKRQKYDRCARVMPKHVRGALELMNLRVLI